MRIRPSNRARLNIESLEIRCNPVAAFHVTNLDASGDGSLAAAIAGVNASDDPDNTIDFQGLALHGDINLQSQLTVSKNVTITGPGTGVSPDVTIHGTQGQLDPFIAGKRVFSSTGGKKLEITNLAIVDGGTNADTDINGGLIKVDAGGYLILRNCWVSGGRAKGDGGAIWVGSGGRMELYGTTVEQNQALVNGGGIAVATTGSAPT